LTLPHSRHEAIGCDSLGRGIFGRAGKGQDLYVFGLEMHGLNHEEEQLLKGEEIAALTAGGVFDPTAPGRRIRVDLAWLPPETYNEGITLAFRYRHVSLWRLLLDGESNSNVMSASRELIGMCPEPSMNPAAHSSSVCKSITIGLVSVASSVFRSDALTV
jgi:hypothetical protein